MTPQPSIELEVVEEACVDTVDMAATRTLSSPFAPFINSIGPWLQMYLRPVLSTDTDN